MTACPQKGTTSEDDTTGDEVAQSDKEYALCTRQGQVQCIANTNFPASSAAAKGSDAIPDLTDNTLIEALSSDESFEFWDSSGHRYQVQGSSLFKEENIRSGVNLFGLTGTLGAAQLLCMHSIQSNCEADSVCEWKNGACAIDPWNIRIGKSIAGVAGQLKTSCRNRIHSALFNVDQLPPGNFTTTAGSNMDWWDTIDDWNLGGAFPSTLVASWDASTDCDKSVWQDMTADGACDSAGDDCQMRDRITGLTWSESYPVSGTAPSNSLLNWSQSIQHCEALVFAGNGDWRLATQKEMQEAYGHGIRDVGYKGGTSRANGTTHNNNTFISWVDGWFWSSTSNSNNPNDGWYIAFSFGDTYPLGKTATTNVICVRP